MNIDFALILVLLSAITGFVWLLDSLLLRKRRAAQRISEGDEEPREPAVVEYSKSFFPVLFIILLIRSFLVEPFTIPSASMVPSLLIGDFILVNKFAYGLRLPVANTKILEIGEPERGDVVVFRYPKNERQNYVKRLVGLPGDEIRYDQHMIYVNGRPAAHRSVGRYVGQGSNAEATGSALLLEQLGDVEHQILTRIARNTARPVCNVPADMRQNCWIVPEGQFFVMGDNRDNSEDSRTWGMVPEENLVGRAFFVWMHWDWKLPGFVSWRRIGTTVE